MTMTAESQIEVFRGTFSNHISEIKDLIHMHWQEAGEQGAEEMELDLDEEVYKYMEDQNLHLGIGLKKDNNLIGYLSIFIYRHHQHKKDLFAQTDGFFVHPKYRGIRTFKAICQAFTLAESILRDEFKVKYFYLGTNAKNELKFLADTLDFVPSTIMYLKRL